MAKGAGGDGKDRKGGLNLEDFRLWKDFTRDIDPLDERDWEAWEEILRTDPAPMPPSRETAGVVNTAASKPRPNPVSPQPAQLDLRTELRLRRGQIPIDGRLDLHGYNQEQAHEMLNRFVTSAHAGGKRCLLIITGKGRGGLRAEDAYAPDLQPGVLKQKLPQWLSMHPLQNIVLKVFSAAPKDGGGGAFYLYLKRHRDY